MYLEDIVFSADKSCNRWHLKCVLHFKSANLFKGFFLFLPKGKRLNCDHFDTNIDQYRPSDNMDTFGEQVLMILSMWDNSDREISHRLCKSPKKKAQFCKIVCPSKLLPQLANIFTRINPSYP